MKLFLIAAIISALCLPTYAYRNFGGDMPFPIGKIVDFPKDDGKGVWKDELKKKIFRLRPLKGVLEDGTILVQMLALNKRVLAEGIGEIDQRKVLTARLRYLNNANKTIDIQIANICADATFDNNSDFSESCRKKQMWAALRVHQKNQKSKDLGQFVIKKSKDDE